MSKTKPETVLSLWQRPGNIRTVSATYTLDKKVVNIDLTENALRIPEGATDVSVVFVKQLERPDEPAPRQGYSKKHVGIRNDPDFAWIKPFDFSDRVFFMLRNENIKSLEELLSYKPHQLLRIPNFGVKCLAEVEKALAQRGLYL